MGQNFKIKRTWKVGEIIYPAHTGTNGLFQKPIWKLVTKVDKKGNIIEAYQIYNYATVKAIELIQQCPAILKYKREE